MADEILGYSFGSWNFFHFGEYFWSIFNFVVCDSSISVCMYIDY